MASARLFRPLARSLQQRPTTFLRPVERSIISSRTAATASFSTKRTVAPFTPSVSRHIQEYGQIRKDARQQVPVQAKTEGIDSSLILKAGMPQLVPFYFMNEVTYAFILLPALIYVLSKYVLPKVVRTRAARLFISKL